MVGKFLYFTALLLTVQKGFFNTHFSLKAAKKKLEKWEEKASAQCDVQ